MSRGRSTQRRIQIFWIRAANVYVFSFSIAPLGLQQFFQRNACQRTAKIVRQPDRMVAEAHRVAALAFPLPYNFVGRGIDSCQREVEECRPDGPAAVADVAALTR